MIAFENNRHKITNMYMNGHRVVSVHVLGKLVWPDLIIDDILSCYYNGYWIDEYPWTDDTPWKD